jgi:hypothetical protein
MAGVRRRLIGWAVVLGLALAACADARAAESTHTTPVVVNVERGGFHWSDAGVGLLAGVGLSLVVCSCLALVRLRDADKSSESRGEGR